MNIDDFYKKISNELKLVEIHAGKKMAGYLKACRLKPYNYFLISKESKLHYKWFDEHNSSIMFKKKFKEYYITLNNLNLSKEYSFCTDPYYGLNLSDAFKISIRYLLVEGCDINNVYYNFYALLGMDKYVRCYASWNNNEERISPLFFNFRLINKLIYPTNKTNIIKTGIVDYKFKSFMLNDLIITYKRIE